MRDCDWRIDKNIKKKAVSTQDELAPSSAHVTDPTRKQTSTTTTAAMPAAYSMPVVNSHLSRIELEKRLAASEEHIQRLQSEVSRYKTQQVHQKADDGRQMSLFEAEKV